MDLGIKGKRALVLASSPIRPRCFFRLMAGAN
jgi:hypothetical protein